jgi:hypothetical protein
MPQILGDVGILVPVHLGVMAVGVGHGEPSPRGLACRNPTQVAGPASARLTAKLTAKPADNWGSWRTTLDGYISPELRRCGER